MLVAKFTEYVRRLAYHYNCAECCVITNALGGVEPTSAWASWGFVPHPLSIRIQEALDNLNVSEHEDGNDAVKFENAAKSLHTTEGTGQFENLYTFESYTHEVILRIPIKADKPVELTIEPSDFGGYRVGTSGTLADLMCGDVVATGARGECTLLADLRGVLNDNSCFHKYSATNLESVRRQRPSSRPCEHNNTILTQIRTAVDQQS
jgi:hypothetical protein